MKWAISLQSSNKQLFLATGLPNLIAPEKGCFSRLKPLLTVLEHLMNRWSPGDEPINTVFQTVPAVLRGMTLTPLTESMKIHQWLPLDFCMLKNPLSPRYKKNSIRIQQRTSYRYQLTISLPPWGSCTTKN